MNTIDGLFLYVPSKIYDLPVTPRWIECEIVETRDAETNIIYFNDEKNDYISVWVGNNRVKSQYGLVSSTI